MAEVCLAERRKKQKWSSDPRGNTWSQDKEKFGYRMLEKMGWNDGAGLGASQDGRTTHVSVNFKNNTLGLGTTGKHADDWIGHQSDFDGLLASLQGQGSAAVSEPTSTSNSGRTSPSGGLQAKAHQSKARINYNKFLRGKDISAYSGTDMSCIFGQRGHSTTASTTQADSSPLQHVRSGGNSDDDDSSDSSSSGSDGDAEEEEEGGLTVSGQSVQDYFAAKMAKMKQTRYSCSYLNFPAASATKTSEDADSKAASAEEEGSTNQTSKGKKKKKKRSRAASDDDNSPADQEPCPSAVCAIDEEEEAPSRKKKRKKQKQASPDAADSEDDTVSPEPPKKKKKSKKPADPVDSEDDDQASPEPSKKKKKKAKKSVTEGAKSTDASPADSADSDKSEAKQKKKKKSKKSKDA